MTGKSNAAIYIENLESLKARWFGQRNKKLLLGATRESDGRCNHQKSAQAIIVAPVSGI